MRLLFALMVLLAFSVFAVPVFACKCLPPPPEIKAPHELAQWHANGTDAIFEGKVVSIELKWQWKEAQDGEVVAADVDDEPPTTLVSLNVLRPYRGISEKHIRIRTGLGGGDCGFRFELGQEYLVYAFKGESGELETSICSGTALVEESQENLEDLRGVPLTPGVAEREAARGKRC